MSRLLAAGLLALALPACRPAAPPTPPAGPAASAPAVLTAAEAAWASEQDRYLGVNVQPSAPLEAVLWRGVRCDFLGRALGGQNSAQDRAIQARMDQLRCGDALLAEARALRRNRGTEPMSVARLDALLARG